MKKIISLLFSFMALVACTSEYDQALNGSRTTNASEDNTVFYATIEGAGQADAQTKVFADSQLRVLWNAGDMVSIFNKTTYNQPYQFKGEDGDNAGGFKKVDVGEEFSTSGPIDHIYAIYPYQETTKISYDGEMTVNLPASQNYLPQSFGIGANTMVSVTDDGMLKFKNAGGYLSFKFYGSGVSVKSISIRGNNHEKLAGKATITMAVGGTPAVTMQASASEEVTLTCNEPVDLNADLNDYIEFWLVLPPTDFTQGFTVTVTDDLGGTFTKSTSKPLSISRSNITRMSPMEVVPNYDNIFVPFEDDNFKAYCVENFDGDGDGKISINEALTVKTIDVCTDEITSLGGIECFKNLKTLKCKASDCSLNKPDGHQRTGSLSKLDLSMNSSLQYLDCSGNLLESLDLSHNPNLWYLSVNINNLWSIDVSNLAKLSYFMCEGNKLKKLNVRNNKELAFLSCSYNYIASLDVTQNTALWHLCCEENELTQLNVENNRKLKTLACSDNQLTSLNVFNNPQLEMLQCAANLLQQLDISLNSSLTYLSCHINQLTDLYLNTALITLHCGENQIHILDVSNCLDLTHLSCTNNPNLTEIWLLSTQSFEDLSYDTGVATLCYRDLLTEEDYEIIDLGLPSGTKWASKNLGAKRSSDIGGRYAWGELETKNSYDWSSYKWAEGASGDDVTGFSKYNDTDKKTELDPEDDIAVQTLGDLWRMPSGAELNELLTLCTWSLGYADGLLGYRVTGPNGNTIFFPFNGQMVDTGTSHQTSVMLWSNEKCEADDIAAIRLICDEWEKSVFCVNYRRDGLCVRPVYGPKVLFPADFPDANFSEYIFTNFDSNHDGFLSEDECESVTTIDVRTDNIYSLKGIEHFQNLRKLSCGGSFGQSRSGKWGEITALDISKNLRLQELSFDYAKVSSIDLSNNSLLTYLSCLDNGITSIDVSNNLNLRSLLCGQNPITELDVSNNLKLEFLMCHFSSLTELNVESNTQLRSLDCYYNSISTLNVSSNKLLERLNCYNNPLGGIDISNNLALESLHCQNCQLSSLDLSTNINLSWLCCSDNQLSQLDLSNNAPLTFVRCDGNPLLTEIFLKTGQTIADFTYDEDVATVKYKD